jgi:hypothetical protein
VRVPDVDDAVKLVTDPAYVSRMAATGPQERCAVKHNRVLRALRDNGAGKAEARELALQAIEKVGGDAEVRASRGAPQTGDRSDSSVESWWVPTEAVRFESA